MGARLTTCGKEKGEIEGGRGWMGIGGGVEGDWLCAWKEGRRVRAEGEKKEAFGRG